MSDDEEFDVSDSAEADDEVRGSSLSRSVAKASKSAKKASASAASTHGKRKKPDVIADDDDEEEGEAEEAEADDEPVASATTASKAASASKASSSGAVGGAGAAARKPNPHAGAARAAMAANKKITTEPEATAVLLDYLNSTNRPYSALNVYDNLHGIIGKSVVPALLDKLAAAGSISCKEYGKFKLYWADQSQYGDTTAGDVAALQEQITEKREQLGVAKAKRRELESTAASLSSSLTAEELSAQLAALRASTAAARDKLARLTGSGVKLVTPAERAAAFETLDRYRRAWAARKRMVCDVVDSMSEGMGAKPKAIMADLGIETDEDAGVSLKDFAISLK